MRTLLCAFLILCGAAPAAAQRIRGAAVDSGGAPVADVVVEIRSSDGTWASTLRTDSAGLFGLRLPAPGRYELQASRLGYAAIGPAGLLAERDRELEIVLRMSTDALTLDPVEVTVRRPARTQLEEVHNRIEWARRIGAGRTLVRDEIEHRAAPTLTALVGSMSPRVRTVAQETGRDTILLRSPGSDVGVCTPTMYIDGIGATSVVEQNLVRPEHLEAVELYIGGAQAPAQYSVGADCGVILFWTRRGADTGAPVLTWRRIAVAGTIAAFILLIGVR